MRIYKDFFSSMTDPESLFLAWQKFRKGKSGRKDVARFEWKLEQNIFKLHRDLISQEYHHGPYTGFYITDPKQRHIHKASVRDRVVHHAVYQALNPIFESTFIANSFSCRLNKGTHRGVTEVEKMTRKVSQNFTKPCFALKCDIKRFFDSINHEILLKILKKRIKDADTIWLLERIIHSFVSRESNLLERKGLPIGNLTSQFFANVYMNEFDQFVKHELRIKCYARYTDDFVIISDNENYLANLVKPISCFLCDHLKLKLHPGKMSLLSAHQGIDFLGYVVRPHYRIMRTKTKRRMFNNLKQKVDEFNQGELGETNLYQSLNSYSGVMSHADTYKLKNKLMNELWFKGDDLFKR